MWTVVLAKEAEKELKKSVKKRFITNEDIKILKIWVAQIEKHGPEQIQKERRWNDHPLFLEWSGYRSSCFSSRGRIIYKIFEKKVVVEVVKITAHHDYTKGDKNNEKV